MSDYRQTKSTSRKIAMVNNAHFLKNMRNNEEEKIQAALVQHLQLRGAKDMLFLHPANGGKRNVVEAVKFKRLGVLPGASDLLFWRDGQSYALELKAKGNRPTDLQDDFMERFKEAGGYAFWVDGLDEALAVLNSWGLIR